MTVIAVAQTKGGVGKTTTTTLLAAEAARRGEVVITIDADPGQRLALMANQAAANEHDLGFSVEPVTTIEQLTDAVLKASETASLIIIDLLGAKSQEALAAMVLADFVLVPTMSSQFDLAGALETIKQVKSAGRLSKPTRDIPYAVMLNRTAPGAVRPVVQRKAAEDLQAMGVAMLAVELMGYQKFQDMSYTGVPPVGDGSKAAENVSGMYDAVVAAISDALKAA